jgi:hypothetical protein
MLTLKVFVAPSFVGDHQSAVVQDKIANELTKSY